MRDRRRFTQFVVADRLHVPLSVVLAMTVEEFNGWQAFAVVKDDVFKNGFDDD